MNIDDLLEQVAENADYIDHMSGQLTFSVIGGMAVLAVILVIFTTLSNVSRGEIIFGTVAVAIVGIVSVSSIASTFSPPPHNVIESVRLAVADGYGVSFSVDVSEEELIEAFLNREARGLIAESVPVVVDGVMITYYLLADGESSVGVYRSTGEGLPLLELQRQ